MTISNDEDFLNANCKSHGGRALLINCWECSAEFAEDDKPVSEDEE
jgi:hypothetical protein